MVAAFKERLREIDPMYITFEGLQTLQVNLGNLCNLSCAHCHVSASPAGDRIMGPEVMEKIVGLLTRRAGITLDITGGCPEMTPHFRALVEGTRGCSPRRMVRSNLTIMTEPGMEWLPEFYREEELVVIASLPCYQEENVERQRGTGVFARSIEALRILNGMGYGDTLELNLVYNPGGPFIPGSQRELEEAYKAELLTRYGIRFNNLYTIANAPIGRFREYLEAKGAYERYLAMLATRFNPEAARNIMCRTLVSVDWKGFLYNCDFNQAVGLPITSSNGEILKIDDLEEAAATGAELFLAQHCYCCTAGEGSSCTGALS
ncbi:arsenosugar biosynthesis radical SAM protein ArsS [Geobacter hydrogenophilus]|uniref:Radical SAM/Cys-rich domain protein n=1 Tax=Geobacter hydrogenophilus TaxID=40983 RepID=A0A9W6G3K5_9BACT|nr:arsenosugar biosynthesis radical SAM (seleno)protein ArsS [Geobacter hydrogenophilus]MBT0892410.1 arsenosugar biosynthesis radical SAM protein ArsS [Geobacter hydrogenophilus]GLI39806.1 radical SAM/Cys-rich domain protein [Geobacter hydrogenophilus]